MKPWCRAPATNLRTGLDGGKGALPAAAVAVLVVFAWQAATVAANYGGNATGLFRIGYEMKVPPELAQGAYRNAHPSGYDGQFYLWLAHDPFLRSDTEAYLDQPLMRARRILVPLLAWTLALGQRELINGAFILVIAAFIFGGVFWLGRIMELEGRHAALGLLFLIMPATITGLDAMTVDVALAALTACFAWQWRSGNTRWLWITIAAAPLVRETGILLTAACVLAAMYRREARTALVWATAAVPMIGWNVYLHLVLSPAKASVQAAVPSWVWPQLHVGILERALHPSNYPQFSPAIQTLARTLDELAVAGTIAAVVIGVMRLRTMRPTALRVALGLSMLLLLTMTARGFWESPYSYGRPLAPLFMLLMAGDGVSIAAGGWTVIGLMAAVDLRVLAELRTQVIGVVSWLSI